LPGSEAQGHQTQSHLKDHINVCKCIVDNTYSCLHIVAINVDRQMDIIKS